MEKSIIGVSGKEQNNSQCRLTWYSVAISDSDLKLNLQCNCIGKHHQVVKSQMRERE